MKYIKIIFVLFLFFIPNIAYCAENTDKTYRDLLNDINDCFSDRLFVFDDELDRFFYFSGDTPIITDEFVDYCNSNLDKHVSFEEYNNRIKQVKNNIVNMDNFSDYNTALDICSNYFKGVEDIVKEGKDAVEFFSRYGQDEINGSITMSLALHEGQHELSARKSGCYGGRAMTSPMTGVVYWNFRPSVFHFYDCINEKWFSIDYVPVPESRKTFLEMPKELTDTSSLFRDYGMSSEVANIYGVYGLLQEYCSYFLELFYRYQLYSYGYFSDSIVESSLRNAVTMRIYFDEYIRNLKDTDFSTYMFLMTDSNLIEFLTDSKEFINLIIEEYDVPEASIEWWNNNLCFSLWRTQICKYIMEYFLTKKIY